MADQIKTRTYPAGIDDHILQIASLTDLPRQPVDMNPQGSFLGAQIQQIKTAAAAPVVNSAAPVNVTRRALGGGVFQYRVQFIAPTAAQDPNYQSTSILLASANGSTRLVASRGVGPIVFNSTKTAAPGSLVVQQDNLNSSSDTGLGIGKSLALVEQ